jgi:hypothetical protein
MDTPAGPPTVDDPLRPYRSWASVLFALLAIVGLVVLVLVLTRLPEVAQSVLVLALVPSGIGIALFFLVVLALGRMEPWAVHAIQPVCVVLIVAGIVRSVIAFGGGEISIPLEAIGAAMVLTRDHRLEILPALDEGGRRTMWIVVAVLAVLQVLPLFSPAT